MSLNKNTRLQKIKNWEEKKQVKPQWLNSCEMNLAPFGGSEMPAVF